MSNGGPEVPAALAITEQQLDTKQPVRLAWSVRNPTSAHLWIKATAQGSFARVHPGILTIAPGGTERLTAIVETAGVTSSNHASARIHLAWRTLATAGSSAAELEGEAIVRLEVPRPRKPQPCPRAGCTGTVREGDRACGRCGLLLRFCPGCGVPNSRVAATCRNDGRPLRQAQDWPQIAGSAARDGSARRALPPRAAHCWWFRADDV
jgi:hypothetical protein